MAGGGDGAAAGSLFCNIPACSGFDPAVTLSLPTFAMAELLRWLVPAAGEEPVWAVPPDGDEAVWLARVADGDEAGLQLLFDKWKRPLLSYFYRALGSHTDAEDLTLEVMVRLHRSAADYRPTAKFSTYLFHIARNLARNEYRRRRRKPARMVPPELFDTMEGPEAGSPQRVGELEEMLQRALERLPEKQRTALLLIYQQQMEYAAAAATLRLTENAFRVLVHRARQQLKSEMEATP